MFTGYLNHIHTVGFENGNYSGGKFVNAYQEY